MGRSTQVARRRPADRLGRLRQGLLHHLRGDDAFDARRREPRRPGGLAAHGRRLCQAVPHARLLPDLGPVPGPVIDRDWRTYLDRKVVHFVYFYLLWTAIQFAFKAPVFVHEHGALSTIWLYAESFWEPFSTLWFIYLLPIFFVVDQAGARPARSAAPHLARRPPRSRSRISTPALPSSTSSRAASSISTPATCLRRASSRSRRARDVQPEIALAGLVGWGLINGVLVFNGYRRAARWSRSRWDWPAPPRSCRSPCCWRRATRRAAALLRAQFDRHLSRLLPADGRDAAWSCSRPAGSPTSARSRCS